VVVGGTTLREKDAYYCTCQAVFRKESDVGFKGKKNAGARKSGIKKVFTIS